MKSFTGHLIAGGLIAATAFFNLTAAAHDAGFYVGGAAGQAKTDIDPAPFTALGAVVTENDERNSMFRIYGGYDVNKHLGIEVAYVDLGAFGVSGTIGGLPFTAFGDTTGYSIAGIGTLPLSERFSLFGSFGVFYSKVKAQASVAAVAGAAKDSDTDLTAGIGIKYGLSKNWAARLEATHYGLGDNGDAHSYTLGFQYKF